MVNAIASDRMLDNTARRQLITLLKLTRSSITRLVNDLQHLFLSPTHWLNEILIFLFVFRCFLEILDWVRCNLTIMFKAKERVAIGTKLPSRDF